MQFLARLRAKNCIKREFGAFGRAIGAWGCLKVSFQTVPNDKEKLLLPLAEVSKHENVDLQTQRNLFSMGYVIIDQPVGG
jgi:hypothetical protein